MKILALETCFSKFSLALFDKGKEIYFFESSNEHQQAERLIPEIENALHANNIWYNNLDYIAAAIGPGSFTGLRIGLAAAKGIALATNIKTVAVTTLEAAAQKKGSFPIHLNAGGGQAYFQAAANSAPELIEYAGAFDAAPTAREVAKIAANKTLNSKLSPLYIKKPDAKLPANNLLTRIHSSCFEKAWTAEQFNDLEYIIHEDVGFIAYKNVLDECEIKTICVLPQFRRAGIAKNLMQKFLQKNTAAKIFLEVSKQNAPAINLYKNLGFEIFGERQNYYSAGDDALLMRKSVIKKPKKYLQSSTKSYI